MILSPDRGPLQALQNVLLCSALACNLGYNGNLLFTDLEALLVAIALALCDFKSLQFEIALIPICDLGI